MSKFSFTLFSTGLLLVIARPGLADTSLSELAQFTGEVEIDSAGNSVASAGDVNNDGYCDFIVGAYLNSDSATEAGAAYLIYGQATQYSGTQSLSTFAEFTGEAAVDVAGRSVASAGDVNNDGYGDFMVGARQNDDAGENAGAAYLIYGQATQYSGTQSLSTFAEFTGEAAGDRSGTSINSAGDVNNDGYYDFMVGATHNDDAGTQAGASYFIYGQATQYSGTQSLSTFAEFTGENESDYAGYSVASVGDVDNDGHDDVMVGAIYNDDSANAAGAAYLIYGQTAQYSGTQSLSTFAEFTGENESDYAGYSVANAGDINHDQYADLLVGASSNDAAASDAGAVYLIYGQSTQYSGTQSLSTFAEFTGEAANNLAGYKVSSFGDYNGDRYFEILIGAPGNGDSGDAAGAVYLGYMYVDADLDGAPGTAGLLDGADCDDSDSSLYENKTFYQDSDGDGLGSDTTTSYCSLNPPSGYVTNSNDQNDSSYDGNVDTDGDGVPSVNDCNDEDSTITSNQTYYQDVDGDGVGGTTTFAVCLTAAPTGYTTTNTDCNDADSTVSTNQTYYQDADGDGFGNLNSTEVICAGGPSTGYVTNSTDDDDTTFGDISSITINDDGTVTVDYTNTASQLIDPFSDSTTVIAETSLDARRVVVTNGKWLKVYRDASLQASKRINKRKPKSQFVKLKIKQFYTNYESIVVATVRRRRGKLTVVRLTSADQLKKKVSKSIPLSRRIQNTVQLRTRTNSQRITVRFDRKTHRVSRTYRLKASGRLRKL